MPSTSRRAFLAAAPAVAVTLGAGAAYAVPGGPVHAAIERHKAAQAAFDAAVADGWGEWRGDIPGHLVDEEDDAVRALAATPCQNDAEFVAKLRRLAERQEWLNGNEWTDDTAEPVLKAIDLHMRREA